LLHTVNVHIGDRYVEYLENKIKELEINGKNKDIIDCIGTLKIKVGLPTLNRLTID